MSSSRRVSVCLLILSAAIVPASAQWVTQTVDLSTGWNAVFLEIDPYPSRCDLLLRGMPIESVWAFDARSSSVQFIQTPGDLPESDPGWRRYFPGDRPEAFAADLFYLEGARPYLIKTSEAFTWQVKGKPLLREYRWNARSLNLVGFFVDPASPPTFSTWFAASPAHQPIDVWQLDTQGDWQKITNPAGAVIIPGEAYWVSCSEESDYCLLYTSDAADE